MPESPRWLIAHGRDEEGLRVIAALAGVSMDHPTALQQRAFILESIRATSDGKASYKDMLLGGKKQNLRRVIIGASSQVHQQLGGCNAVIYYATILFENNIRLSRDLSLILGGVLAIVYALFALLSFVIVERVGRRPLFLIGTAGQGVAMYITWASLISNTACVPRSLRASRDLIANLALTSFASHSGGQKSAAFGLYLFIAFFVSFVYRLLTIERALTYDTVCVDRELPSCPFPGSTRPSSILRPFELRPTLCLPCATGCSTSWLSRCCLP
jgi:hypothetical protein